MADEGYVPRGFHWADYLIFGATIVVSSAIGVFFACSGGKQKTTAEYLLGNRNQRLGPVAMSLIVSFESSIMMLGFPAEMYAHGTHYWMAQIGSVCRCVIISQTFVPLFHPLKLTSSFEYLNMRYTSRPVRLLGSFLGILSSLWYMGIVLFGPATALQAVTGFPIVYSIILVTVAAVFYTTLGGFKAVIWSDVLQFVIMLVGILAIVIGGTLAVGGVNSVVEYLDKGGRIILFDFNPDPRTRLSFWNVIIAGSIRGLGLGINQSTVQRISSMKTVKGAKMVMLLGAPGFFLFSSLAHMEGLIAYAYFAHTHCDPLEAKFINNTNQIIPYFVMELFRNQPGLPGLFLVSLFSASLSTLSSGFSSISANLWSDFLKPCFPNVSELKATIITKSTVIVIGGLAVGIAFLVMEIGGPLHQISWTIVGSVEGPLTGLFLLGALFPRATAKGALTGCITALIVVVWIAMGASFSPLARKTAYLPPAPTDGCYGYNTSAIHLASNVSWNGNDSMRVPVMKVLVNTSSETVEELSGVESIMSYIYSISFMWYSVLAMFITVFIGLIVSYATGPNPPNSIDPKYIMPIFDNLFCYLPKSMRDKLRYGKDFVPQNESDNERELFELNQHDKMSVDVEYK